MMPRKIAVLFPGSWCLVAAFVFAVAAHADDTATFKSLFNGTDLEGWDGDPRFWRVESGEIIGETTANNQASTNTFLIYRGGEFGDFILRFRYQCEGYNSGVQYRSVDEGNWVMSGYQSDFEDRWHENGDQKIDKFTGMFFEEKGRMFLGQRGDIVVVRANPDDPDKHQVEKIGTVGDPVELDKKIHRGDWNEMVVIAEGNTFIHLVNGQVLAIGIDEHEAKRRDSGLIGFQLHRGPPMKIRVKDIQLRRMSGQ